MKNVIKQLTTFALLLVLVFNFCSCSSGNQSQGSSGNDFGDTITEVVIPSDTISENVINQVISEEIYLKEILVTEDKIKELLIQEDRIEEVLLCKTIYVYQDNINDFSEHGQMDRMFGDGIELGPLLTKISIGTGVIVTLTVLSIAGLEGPVASIVASAAPSALEGALIGTGVGTLVGGLTGTADEIDETGRTSAIIGFSVAVVGFIIATISAVAAIPSGGSTAAAIAFGIKVAIAGMSLATAGYAGYKMVKTLTTTSAPEIDWNNVDWNKVGVSAAEQAINGAADGYVWGSIIGAVEGGAKGYEFYEKYGTPYSTYNARIAQTPKEGSGGHWTGQRGESTFILDEPIICKNGTVVAEITYQNGVPDFSKCAIRQVKIEGVTNNRISNFRQADELLAEYWTKVKFDGRAWTARDVSNYRTSNGLTWHEMNNMDAMQLVPTEVNATWGHLGGVGEYNAMVKQKGGVDFD